MTTAFSFTPSNDREWMGWPQAGWVRPSFPVYVGGVLHHNEFGDPVFWRQESAETDAVVITEAEYDECVARWRAELNEPLESTPGIVRERA